VLDGAAKPALPLLCYSGGWGDPLRPDERLIVAVLEHAVGLFQRYALAPDRGGRLLFADIDAWFATDDIDYPFAFVSICDVLGLDVAYVRSGLRQWRESRKPYISFRQPAPHPVSHLRAVPAPSALRPARGPVR
jgi:hypothetical protein